MTTNICEVIETLFEMGIGRMEESQLPYHNIEHVNFMLDTSVKVVTQSNLAVYCQGDFDVRMDAVLLAIAWHDVVYKVGAPSLTNEAASAQALLDAYYKSVRPDLSEDLHKQTIDVIFDAMQLIMVTGMHFLGYQPKTIYEALILDLDIANFACDYETFKHNNVNVADEFATVFGHDAAQKGRVEFLEKLGTFDFYLLPKEEAVKANENIQRLLAELKG